MSEGKSPENLALYRKYRSRNLDEVLGQPQVTTILKAAAKNDDFAHAYLLVGQRGTGKTSVARILAHLINATPYDAEDFDIIEIDAASHGSVDDARELRDRANLAPLKARNKVYIIDEVHMLSRQAFDALLKLIEEPPAHLYFILATTELQKVPATILSRIQRFTFHPVAPEIVSAHLRKIANDEKIAIDDDALNLIAERGEGSFRDSITLLDQLRSFDKHVSIDDVEAILGLAPRTAVQQLIDNINRGEIAQLIKNLENLFADGNSATELAKQLTTELLKRGTTEPKFYALIEPLLDVAKSSNPRVKLLAVLVNFAQKSSTAAGGKTETKVMSAVVEKSRNIKEIRENVVPTKAIISPKKSQIDKITEKNEVDKIDDNQKIIDHDESPTTPKSTVKLENFDWKNVLSEFEKLDEPAALSIAHAAEIQLDDNELTLFFAKRFQRNRAKTRHFADILNKAVENSVGQKLTIIVSNDLVPPNSSAANVLDILGGDIVQI